MVCTESKTHTLLVNVSIEGNSAPAGGAVWAQSSSTCALKGAVLRNNTATAFSGASRRLRYMTVALTHAIDSKNVCTNTLVSGGAISTSEQATLSLTDCVLQHNQAQEHGGAVFLSESSHVVAVGGNVSSNIGACSLVNGKQQPHRRCLSLFVCVVYVCMAAFEGGGFGAVDTSVLDLSRVQVASNAATHGGGLWSSGRSVVTLASCVFQHNTASRTGGALTAVSSSSGVLRGTTVRQNTAMDGAGVYLDSRAVWRLSHGVFDSNAAATSGGGLYTQVDSELVVQNTSFVFNSASVTGGGVHGGFPAGSSTVGSAATGGTRLTGAQSSRVVPFAIFANCTFMYGCMCVVCVVML